MKRIQLFRYVLAPLLALVLLLGLSTPVMAGDFPSGWPQAPEITEETGILMDADTGQVLYDKGMDEIRYPASTTKVMTALLILENIEDLDMQVTLTDVILPDLEPGNSSINGQVGEVLTVEQCLYAIMLASANEICTQMAVQVAGSVDNFVAMMNQRAAELGCKNTHFVNANGLPDPDHYTTAHDLAIILAEAVKNEDFCKIAGADVYTIPATNKTSQPRNLENHNALLTDGEFQYEGAIAGKTGHTEAAKNTLVTAATRDDMTLVCVVMRSDGDDRFTDTISLFDYGFNNFHKVPLYWTDAEPVAYVDLPNDAPTDCLTVSDSDNGTQRTRTYSYRGVVMASVQKELPLEVETIEPLLFARSSLHQINSPDRIFLVMMLLLALVTLAFLIVTIKGILDHGRKKKKKSKKKTGIPA